MFVSKIVYMFILLDILDIYSIIVYIWDVVWNTNFVLNIDLYNTYIHDLFLLGVYYVRGNWESYRSKVGIR